MTDLTDLFEFVLHERTDVRKAAAQGLAQLSRDNNEMAAYIAHNDTACVKLLQLLNVEKYIQTLGDILTALVNIAANAEASDRLIQNKIVPRMIKLIDALDRAQPGSPAMALGPEPLVVFKELSLMLLNNLTASSVAAVLDLLQVDDEDLQGFFLGKLKTMMDRLDDDGASNEASAPPQAQAASASAAAPEERPAAPPRKRNLRKWYLQIVLNSTRAPQGQRILCADDDWLPYLVPVLKDKSSDPIERYVAAQVLRNCATGGSRDSVVKEKLVQRGAPGACVQCLHDDPDPGQTLIHVAVAETLAALITIGEGVAALESINAKALLSQAIRSPAISAPVAQTIREDVLPFLDDVQDVFVNTAEE